MPEPTWKIDHGPREELPWWEDQTKIKLAATVVVAVSVCGVIWYAYFSDDNIQKKDTNGATTVINASQDPVRARPTEPGGQQIPHQNATVYERLNVDSTPAPAVAPLPLPEKPIEKPAAPTILAPLPAPGAPVAQPAPAPEQPVTRLPLSAHTELAQAQPVQPQAQPETPAQPLAPLTAPTAPVQVTETPLAQPVIQPPVKPTSPLADAPKAQPVTPAPLPLPEPKPQPAPKPQPVAKAGPVAGGAYRIQLAALASEDKAQAAWSSAVKKHSFLSGLTLFVDKVNRNGSLFYRVQAGPFESKQAAADMCAQLKNNNAACMVVKP